MCHGPELMSHFFFTAHTLSNSAFSRFFFIPPSVLEGYYTHFPGKSAVVFLCRFVVENRLDDGFYGPNSSIADVMWNIYGMFVKLLQWNSTHGCHSSVRKQNPE